MRTLDVLVAAFAAFMLVRHGPRALALLRRPAEAPRAMGIVAVVNVALAAGLLAFALKGMIGSLVSR